MEANEPTLGAVVRHDGDASRGVLRLWFRDIPIGLGRQDTSDVPKWIPVLVPAEWATGPGNPAGDDTSFGVVHGPSIDAMADDGQQDTTSQIAESN